MQIVRLSLQIDIGNMKKEFMLVIIQDFKCFMSLWTTFMATFMMGQLKTKSLGVVIGYLKLLLTHNQPFHI